MKDLISEILNPKVLSSIEGLELTAKVIVEGYFSGYNQSKRIGVGHEFSQYRSYQPGDDLRLMDWKMYARSERYYIRQSEVETNINVKFIIDASKSMLHQDGPLKKIEYARMLAAALAYIAKNQGDAYGVLWANNVEVQELHARQSHLHFQRFLHYLLSIEPDGGWLADYEKLARFYDPNRRELIVFISDMHDPDNDLLEFSSSLKNPRNEVLVFHLLGGNELDQSFEFDGLYEDLETGEQIRLEPRKSRDRYKQIVQKEIDSLKESLLNSNVGYTLFRTDEDVDQAISSFIKMRSQLI